jgi:hypothetical protein
MANLMITLNELSRKTGVSYSTIRAFVKKGYLSATDDRPSKVDISDLPESFYCLYEDAYEELGSYCKRHDLTLNQVLGANSSLLDVDKFLVSSPKQNSGHWWYVRKAKAAEELLKQGYAVNDLYLASDAVSYDNMAPKVTFEAVEGYTLTLMFNGLQDRTEFLKQMQAEFSVSGAKNINIVMQRSK